MILLEKDLDKMCTTSWQTIAHKSIWLTAYFFHGLQARKDFTFLKIKENKYVTKTISGPQV